MTMIAQSFGNYRVLEKIGEGGMGEVFRGIDVLLEREVAIKSLHPELARRQEIVERFRAEAKTLAKLNHPNIATLYSFIQQDDQVFMVMEFVRGNPCDKIIKAESSLPWTRAVALIRQALQGIAYAHRLGVIHRDLKPSNLMLTDAGAVKVLDFGIARLLGAPRMTQVGHFLGTLAYVAPEQLRGDEVDARADMYALGIVLYELLTGRLPFAEATELGMIKAHLEAIPQLPPHLARCMPEEITQALMRALAKTPEARFQTVDEFSLALENGLRAASTAEFSLDAGPIVLGDQQRKPSSTAALYSEIGRDTWSVGSRLTQLYGLLFDNSFWKRYPGIVVLLILLVVTLGLLSSAPSPFSTNTAAPLPPLTLQPPPMETEEVVALQPDIPSPSPVSNSEFLSPPVTPQDSRFSLSPGPGIPPSIPSEEKGLPELHETLQEKESAEKTAAPPKKRKRVKREARLADEWVFKK